MPKKQLASEALIDLHRRLSVLPSRSHERRLIVQETANLIWSIRTNALSGVGAKGTAQGVCAAGTKWLPEVAEKFGWSEEQNARLSRPRAKFIKLCPAAGED